MSDQLCGQAVGEDHPMFGCKCILGSGGAWVVI